MNKVVLYEGWQMACCGTDFSVGDHIELTVNDTTNMLDIRGVGTIDFVENHHEDLGRPGVIHILKGKVNSISLLYARYEEEDNVRIPKEWIKKDTKSTLRQNNDIGQIPTDFEFCDYLVEISEADIQSTPSS